MLSVLRQTKGILISIIITALVLSVFIIHISLVLLVLAAIIFTLTYYAQELNLKCQKCKKPFTLRLIESKTLSSNYIEKDIKKKKKYIRKVFCVGEKEKTYKCENCGHTVSKITKYKERI